MDELAGGASLGAKPMVVGGARFTTTREELWILSQRRANDCHTKILEIGALSWGVVAGVKV